LPAPRQPALRTGARRNRNGAIIAAGLAAAVVALGAVPRIEKRSRLDTDARAAVTALPLVDTVHPLVAPTATHLALPGNIQAIDETAIDAQSTGYVHAIYADIGSRVTAGQMIAEIASPEVDQQYLSAQADLGRSDAVLKQSQADVDRTRAGAEQAEAAQVGAGAALAQSRSDVIRYQARELQARAAVASSRADFAQSKERLDRSRSELDRAKVAADLARVTYQRWQQLGAVNAVSGQEVDEKQADNQSATANLSAAQDAVAEAQANMESARDAIEAARANDSAAAADIDAARQRVDAAKAVLTSNEDGVVAAFASVAAGEQNVAASAMSLRSSAANSQRYAVMQGFQRVTAPFDGVITARNVDVGTLVNATGSGDGASDPTHTVTKSGLFGIARTDVLRIQIDVPQSFVPYLHEGQFANVTVPEYPGKTFTGRVFTMSGALDESSRTMLAEVRVPNPTGKLIPGMYARVDLVGSRPNPPLILPANTLIFNADGERVATVTANDRIHFVPIQIERDLGNEAEIATALSPTDRIVSDPTDDLTEGGRVQIAQEQAAK
jgi:RND family efflux transporter MFP subunit